MSPILQAEALAAPGFGPVDLELMPGERLLLSGPSGSGKSRLLRALADIDPHQGQLRLEGVAAEAIPPCEWRRRVGLLPAESRWWGEQVGEHFDGEPDARLWQQLGFSTATWEWEVSRLSSGERQRLALLRLLQHRPPVLLLDEPSANLDRESSLRVEALLERYRQEQGAAMIWVSHDAEQRARLGGRQLQMAAGRLVEAAA